MAEGKVLGWFQGALEGGPRARSILADPRTVESRDRVNSAIKFREFWRPFCPSMKVEAVSKYAQRPCEAPYMTLAFPAQEIAKQHAPGIVHIDNTMRLQTVSQNTNPRYYKPCSVWDVVRGEVRAAMKVLVVEELIFEELPAVCVAETPIWDVNRRAIEILRRTKPEVLYVPFLFDMHRDHRELFHAFSVGWRPHSSVGTSICEIYTYEVPS